MEISLSLSLTGRLLSSSPATALFSVPGSRGFFYDFSDYNTQFTDTAGTTAITGVGQSLGLVLDKSQGLVLGPELVTNGFFDSGSAGWDVVGADATHIATFSGGTLRYQSDTTSPQLVVQQNLILTIGRTYLIEIAVSSWTSGSIKSDSFGGNTILATGVGTRQFRVTASATTFQITRNSANVDITIDYVSVRELPGNHATQATAGSRALTQVRPMGVIPRNLLTFSEAFDNAIWAKGGGATISNTTTVGPLGTGFAQKLQEAATTNAFSISVAPGMALNTTHVFTVYMKAAERSFGILNIFTGSASCWTWYNLSSGTVGTVGAGATASMVSVGDGWYRCSISIATAASGTPNVGIWPANANGSISYAGTAGSGILLWGAQLELGSTASTYQPTGPALINGERRNLLTWTEQFDNAAWTATRATVSANSDVAPNGTTTADKLVPNTDNNTHFINRTLNLVGTYTLSAFFKASGYSRVLFSDGSGLAKGLDVDIQNGTIFSTGSSVSNGFVQAVGNGWFRVSFTITDVLGFTTFIDNGSGLTFAGNGTSGILIWGAQLEVGSTPTAYQRVVTANEWYEPGFTSYRGISFDGVDDFLQTAAIDFSNSDKMTVVAGVRKLSDAARSSIVELTNAAPNRFSLEGPDTVIGSRYGFLSSGSITSAAGSAGFAAPHTAVLTGQGDISGDSVLLRVNGTQVAQATTDQGTGNYANDIVYIGRRGGTTLPFNGVLTFLCVINRTLTASELAQLETFANSRTGAY